MNAKRYILGAVIACAANAVFGASATVTMRSGEGWWGAANSFGPEMPFDAKTVKTIDVRATGYWDQSASFLVSDQGRVIWCDAQARFDISNGVISVDGDAPVCVEEGGKTLAEGYRYALKKWFPPSGKMPEECFFSAPQINTWIELTYHQNEKDVLAYAESMLSNGVPPGVIMIDDTWQAGYGDWRFEPERFHNPKGMVAKLHAMGYKVMLWICPYVSMDTPAYRRIAWGKNPDDVRGYPTRGGFLIPKGAKPSWHGGYEAIPKTWWNGISALLDFSHPNANAWLKEQLDRLVRDYGIDGFKLDGSDHGVFTLADCQAHDPKATNGSLCQGFAKFALRYPYCEFRSIWRMQQMPVVMRLHDKRHSWYDLRCIIPEMTGAGLLGHPYICPDMAGGGDHLSFLPGSPFDPELFVRSVQVHALSPMMQFSASPWRVLDARHQQIVRDSVALRQRFAPRIVALARQAAKDGEPIIRNLEYEYPHQGYADVKDVFLMGQDLLVAPQLEKGARSRTVPIPNGTWRADDGMTVVGPKMVTVTTPLERLPYFERIKGTGDETALQRGATMLYPCRDAKRQTVIAEGGMSVTEYQGHPTTVVTEDGRVLCVWTIGHGGPCGPAAESTDDGRTWTRIDGRFPAVYHKTHANCPTLQKCRLANGRERLFIFSAKASGDPKPTTRYTRLGIMISDDGGKTWREGAVADLSAAMPPTGFMQLTDGTLALFGQVRDAAWTTGVEPNDDQRIWMSVSSDGGETWGPMRTVAARPGRNLCEPCCIRSPDGGKLMLILRENRHLDRSMFCVSEDEGKTWTAPRFTAAELTGDRHEALALPDGRYLICFRNQNKDELTGQYIGFVGTWDDIVAARPGQYRLHLLRHYGREGWPGNKWDTGYSGVELLRDGSILCTTYSRHFNDARFNSIVSVRLDAKDIAQ